MPFKLGDVVYLKSGGPAMTIFELTKDGYVSCIWFGNEGEICTWDFEPEMLAQDDRMTIDGDELHLDALVRDQVYARGY